MSSDHILTFAIQFILAIENNLRGSLPEEIKHLTALKSWVTPFNYELTSSLEPFLAMPSLEHLELQYCNINGQIPDNIGTMQQLQFVGLGKYRKFGFFMQTCDWIAVEKIFSCINGLIFFVTLSTIVMKSGNNQLFGAIPDSFFTLTNLVVLGLDDNMLETNIDKFRSFTKMQKLYIEGKKLFAIVVVGIALLLCFLASKYVIFSLNA